MDESTTCAMRIFQQEPKPMIAVDVRSKALFAYFGVTIHETRPFTPGGPEANPSTFRVKIPFLQLAQLWEVHDPESHEMSLIVILDSPPVYHRQSTDILATFNTQSSWRDTDLWLRQTCIAHNLGAQDQAKISLRRSGQIVDLGMLHLQDYVI
jgi:RNA-dependent RNA polymerase